MAKSGDRNGFELLKRLASGGMGEVFVARKMGTADFEKRVALKLLLPHLTASSDSVKRFYAEARLAARMHHPNIVEIFDVGEAEGRPFIAMQLIEGLSLAQYLQHAKEQRLTMPLPIARAIAMAICEALAYAHDLKDAAGRPLKLVHRDVTPSNVLLSFNGAIQLTDFGIARVGDAGTRTGSVQGKAAYVAPEQLTQEVPVDARADLYSAAVTLYELITFDNPFRRKSQDETFAAILLGKPAPVRQHRPDVSVQMESALQRAMARKADQRFADATSFRKAFIDGPVASAPDLAEHLRLLVLPRAGAPEEPSSPVGTKSQVLRVTHSISVDVTPTPQRPLWPVWLAASLAVVVAAGLSLGALRQPLHTPNVEAVNEAPPPSPPLATPPPLAIVEPPAPVEPVTTPEPAARKPDQPRSVPSRPKPTPAPTGLQIGYLAADAVPWADVVVDGARVDRTPFSKYPLPAGRHEVLFTAPDGRSQVKSITIAEGTVTSLRVDFSSK
ncbi:MAG: serine/threonine protein kinase [Archangiaceae bacterium]|nr:serine/threonine protein kinase [Archangiaceae bacterium]